MVEHRPWNDIIAYAILTLGVFIVAFPVYLALIASTHDAATVVGGNTNAPTIMIAERVAAYMQGKA